MSRNITISGNAPLGISVTTEDGDDIPVCSLKLTAVPNDITRAWIEVPIMRLDGISAVAVTTHGDREIKRIEYADGGVEEF